MALEPEGCGEHTEGAGEGGSGGDEAKWMPPNWSGGNRGAPPAGVRSSSRGRRGGEGAFESNLKLELDRVRSALATVQRERDLLQGHVKDMEGIVRNKVRAQLSRSTSAPPRATSAPNSARGSDSTQGAAAFGSSSARSASAPRKRINKDEEKDMVRRLTSHSWRPNRDARGSGVEQLKKRLEEAEKKEYAKAKPKCKVYKTRQELDDAAQEMFRRDKDRRRRLAETIEAKLKEQIPPPLKSSTKSQYQRDVRLQMLSTPVRLPPRMPRPSPDDRPGWYAGPKARMPALGRKEVLADYSYARAVH